jgi:hypothetical protein
MSELDLINYNKASKRRQKSEFVGLTFYQGEGEQARLNLVHRTMLTSVMNILMT